MHGDGCYALLMPLTLIIEQRLILRGERRENYISADEPA
jgi:hypothetical protein